MPDNNKNLSKIELIKMAREQLIGEYIGQRARDHIQWVKEAEIAWKTTGTWLPYPTMPIYPADAEILTRAMELEKFINKDSNESESQVEPTTAPLVEKKEIIDVESQPVEAPAENNLPNSSGSIMEKLNRLTNSWSFR